MVPRLTPCALAQELLQHAPGVRVLTAACDLCRGPLSDDATAGITGLRPHIENPVGFGHDIEVVLHHDRGVAGGDQSVQHLVGAGNTAVVVEHNLDVMAEADWILDLGPEAGDGGGRIVAQGPPAQIVRRRRHSHTGRVLDEFLRERTRREERPLQVRRA